MTHLSYVHQLETIKGRLFNDLTLNGVGGRGGGGERGLLNVLNFFQCIFFQETF